MLQIGTILLQTQALAESGPLMFEYFLRQTYSDILMQHVARAQPLNPQTSVRTSASTGDSSPGHAVAARCAGTSEK